MKQNALYQIGNTPFSTSVLESLYPGTRQINDKARHLEQDGQIVRLKRGLYVRSAESGAMPVPFLIANHLYGPSYVSFQSALNRYGLIPERVYETQSATTKHNRVFDTPLGRYSYRQCNAEYFHIGICQRREGDDAYLIATPEKALCDLLLKTAGVNMPSTRKLEEYLSEDLRFDMVALADFDKNMLEECRKHAAVKPGLIEKLIKMIQR